MTDRTSMTLTDERRRLEDRVRGRMDDVSPAVLPDERWRTALYDAALTHLLESIENHQEYDGDPELQKAFATSVVRPRYRTTLELQRP